MARPSSYPAELRRRAVRMAAEVLGDYPNESAELRAAAEKPGIGSGRDAAQLGPAGPARLRAAARDDDGGVHADPGDEERDRRAEAGERDPQGRGELLRGRARPATPALVAFIDEHRGRFGGVEPICRVLSEHGCGIAPSICYTFNNLSASARSLRDTELRELIGKTYEDNFRVCGARKIWRELNHLGRGGPVHRRAADARPGHQRSRPRQARRHHGLRPVARAPDLVDRDFVTSAPNRCCVMDFTTWPRSPAWSTSRSS